MKTLEDFRKIIDKYGYKDYFENKFLDDMVSLIYFTGFKFYIDLVDIGDKNTYLYLYDRYNAIDNMFLILKEDYLSILSDYHITCRNGPSLIRPFDFDHNVEYCLINNLMKNIHCKNKKYFFKIYGLR